MVNVDATQQLGESKLTSFLTSFLKNSFLLSDMNSKNSYLYITSSILN